MHGKNNFAEISKSVNIHRFKNNFITEKKLILNQDNLIYKQKYCKYCFLKRF